MCWGFLCVCVYMCVVVLFFVFYSFLIFLNVSNDVYEPMACWTACKISGPKASRTSLQTVYLIFPVL